MTQSKVVLTERTTTPQTAPRTVVLYGQDNALYYKDDNQQILRILAATTAIDMSDVSKIDSAATDGLAGVSNSLAYRVHEIERHFHGWERWMGLAASPSGETHRADSIVDNVNPFVIDAGNNTWGSWVQILGSSDTPVDTGMVKYDLHQIDIVAAETANVVYFIQIAFGETAAGALTAGTYTELVFIPQSANGRPAPIPMISRRQNAGTKAWARNLARGTNTATLSFYIGLHEYPG